MTTACINALTCADYVVLPTSLSEVDIEAVRRTLTWLRELRPIMPGDLLGVVVTRCKMRSGDLVKFDKGQLGNLEGYLHGELHSTGHVFAAKIPDSPEINKQTAERRPLVLDSMEGRAWFAAVSDELERRIGR
jgi:cellulose biosynthesis protein BcsQ